MGGALDLSAGAIWRIINGKRGTRYKVAVEIGKQLDMSEKDTKAAWLELVNNLAKLEIDSYEKAAEKPKISPRKWDKSKIAKKSTPKGKQGKAP